MTTVNADPDEIDRAAFSLAKTRESLVNDAKALARAMGYMPRFQGRDAEKFRQAFDTLARTVHQQAEAVGREVESLRRYAQDVRALQKR